MAGRHAMMGAKTLSPVEVDVQAATYEDIQDSPTNASASVSFNSDGSVVGDGLSYTFRTGGSGAQIQLKFETISGSVTSGTVDTWLSGASNQSIGVERTGLGTKSWVGRIIVRRASDSVELDRADITVTATKQIGGG